MPNNVISEQLKLLDSLKYLLGFLLASTSLMNGWTQFHGIARINCVHVHGLDGNEIATTQTVNADTVGLGSWFKRAKDTFSSLLEGIKSLFGVRT